MDTWGFYKTIDERIAYVGWLLACDAPTNIAKGQALLKLLPSDARMDALLRADQLINEYDKG